MGRIGVWARACSLSPNILQLDRQQSGWAKAPKLKPGIESLRQPVKHHRDSVGSIKRDKKGTF